MRTIWQLEVILRRHLCPDRGLAAPLGRQGDQDVGPLDEQLSRGDALIGIGEIPAQGDSPVGDDRATHHQGDVLVQARALGFKHTA